MPIVTGVNIGHEPQRPSSRWGHRLRPGHDTGRRATHWRWVFLFDPAVLSNIARSRARSVACAVLAGYKPGVWISELYAGQQELAKNHQVSLAHVLRDALN